jgi:gliding motility-associated lipoprotein GldH
MAATSCTDTALVDINIAIPNRNWSYVNRIKVPVTITDPSKAYNLYLNLRQTSDYQYSNIFILLHCSGPGLPRTRERMEFRLAYPDGQWLGSGSGNLISNQIPLKQNFRFPEKGAYLFEIEQNMRDNPLHEISDVGLRIEPAP